MLPTGMLAIRAASRSMLPTGIEPTGMEPTGVLAGIEPTGIEPTGIEPTGTPVIARPRTVLALPTLRQLPPAAVTAAHQSVAPPGGGSCPSVAPPSRIALRRDSAEERLAQAALRERQRVERAFAVGLS